MQRFGKIVFSISIILMLLWLLPWSFRFMTTTKSVPQFTLYSSIVNDFAIIDNSGKERAFLDHSGNRYTEKQFDSILPLFYYRQLMAEERLPDSLHGVAISPKLIQNESFMFRSSPAQVNAITIPLYPLLESMSGRVDLEMPDDVFRMDKRMEFIKMESNRVDEEKSRLFTEMLIRKEFVFPAKIIAGNPTSRKEYDEGYLITDHENRLFHVKQIKGRPYVRFIETPSDIEIRHIFLTEFKNKKSLAFITDSQYRFWVLETKSYRFRQVEIPAFDPETMSISIFANIFDWTISIRDGKRETLYAINADDFSLIKEISYPPAELTAMQKAGRYIFPLRLEFSSPLNTEIFPKIMINEKR